MVNTTYLHYNETVVFEEEQNRHAISKIIMMIVLSASALVGLAGNITVVALVSTRQRLQNITNMYLLNRSLAGILVQCLIPFNITTISMNSFIFGYPFCVIYSFLVQAGYVASLVILVLFAVDCYLASRPSHHSLQYRWKMLKIGAGVTWGATAALMVVPVYFYTEYFVNGDLLFCLEGPVFFSRNIVSYFFFTYVFIISPLIVLWIYISLIFSPTAVRASNTEGVAEGEGKDNASPPRSFLLILAIVATVCYIPYWILKMIMDLTHVGYNIFVLFICVSELCFAINPVLYLWLRKDLRQRVCDYLPSGPGSHLPLEDI